MDNERHALDTEKIQFFPRDSDYNMAVHLREPLTKGQQEKLKHHMQRSIDVLIPEEDQEHVRWFYREPLFVSEEDPLGQYGTFGWRYVYSQATPTFLV